MQLKLVLFISLIFGFSVCYAQDNYSSLEKKAQSGDASAQCELGISLANQQNYIEAVYWFKKAADQGYAEGQYNLT